MLGAAKSKGRGQAKSRPALWRRFRYLIVTVGVVGLTMSLFADSNIVSGDHYWNALREVGGAVVAGAILAGLIVWFEDKREDERFNREETREAERIEREELRLDQAAHRDLLRETFVQLSTVMHRDLANSRLIWLRHFDDETRPRPPSEKDADQSVLERSFQTAIAEIKTHVLLLDDQALTDAYSTWKTAWARHQEGVAHSPTATGENLDSLRRGGLKPPARDGDAHSQTAASEQAAWNDFIGAVHAYGRFSFRSTIG